MILKDGMGLSIDKVSNYACGLVGKIYSTGNISKLQFDMSKIITIEPKKYDSFGSISNLNFLKSKIMLDRISNLFTHQG